MPASARADLGSRASFAYVANSADDTISIYSVDPNSGRLGFEGTHAAQAGEEGPAAMVVHPNGNYLFVANASTANISTYAIDGSNGRLSTLPATATGTGPQGMALDAGGDFLYVTASGSDLVYTYSVDSISGALGQVGSPLASGAGPDAIALDPLGRFAYVTERTALRITILDVDGSTGALSASVPAVSIGSGIPASVVVDATGSHAYVTVENTDLLLTYSIDPATGALSLSNSRATGDQPTDLALRPDGGALYLINAGDGNLMAYAIDAASGTPTRIPGTVETGQGPARVALDPSGLSVYLTNGVSRDVSRYSINGLDQLPVVRRPIRARNTPGAIALRATGPLARRGRHLYVLNEGAATISGYAIDDVSGNLTSVGPDSATGAAPNSLALDPVGRFLYTVDAQANTLSTYAIDEPSGTLTRLPAAMALAGSPNGVAVDPSGLYLYVALDSIDLVDIYLIDPSSGQLSSLATRSIGANVRGIAVDPTGQFVFVTRTGHVEGFRVENGAPVGLNFKIGLAGLPQPLRFSPTGDRAYTSLKAIDRVVPLTIDAITGAVAVVPPGNVTADQPGGMAIHPTGDFAYAAILDPTGSGTVDSFSVDLATGALTALGSSMAGMNPGDLVMDPSGRFVFVSNQGSDNVSLFSIDQSTGLPSSVSISATGATPSDLVMTTSFVTPAPPDCNANGLPDDLDISMSTSFDCNANCIPDECETPDCNANGVPDECDIALASSLDFNMNGIPDECECGSATNYCVTSPHSAGPGGVMAVSGPLDIGTNRLTLQALDCPPQKFGIFFYGNNQIQVPFGEGFRCVGGMTQRINPAVMTNAAGTAARTVDLGAFPFSGSANPVNPGSTWNFQFWFRDPTGRPADTGFNLTDAVSITFCP